MKPITKLLILFGVIVLKINAQSLYQRTYQPFINPVEQELLSNEDLIIAGTHFFNSLSGIAIIRFNECGDTIWSKRIETDSNNLNIIDLRIDSQDNILIAGHFVIKDGDRNVFLTSLSPNGTLNYFKVLDSGTADIIYSMDINAQDEILLYFKNNIGEAGPVSQNTLAKFNANGNIKWIKQYGFTGFWGQMCSSSDGGAIISDIKEIIKVNEQGNVNWSKKFDNNFYSQNLFEIPGGYIFFRYKTSAQNASYATMLDYNGNAKWNSQLISNYLPSKGILRANGNLLFVGDYTIAATINNPTFIEIDSADGSIIRTLTHHENMPLITPYDLNELNNGQIIYSGVETSTFLGQIFLSRINDTLSRVDCNDTLLNLNFPVSNEGTQNNTNWTAQTVNIPLTEPNIYINPLNVFSNTPFCSLKEPLTLNLGKDTTLCPGQSMTLSPTGNFDSYLWSNGEQSEKITINKAGTYWLTATLNCDTISDTIKVDYFDLPILKLGNDTTVCIGEEINLSTNNGEIAYWNTGDTAVSITVKNAGEYIAKVPSPCGFIRDTINLFNYHQLKQPNLGEDTTICINTSINLEVDAKATYILWSTKETSHKIKTDTAGLYTVIIANPCDTLRDTIRLNYHPKTKFLTTISDDTAKVLDSIHFKLLFPKNFNTIQWQFDDGNYSSKVNPIHLYKQSKQFHPKVILTDSLGCLHDSTFNILIQQLPFKIPNVFTPNGDGINDYFKVFGEGIESMHIKVLNRWGDLIFKSNSAAWDGRTNDGKAASDGTYFYQIKFKQTGSKEQLKNGQVTLIRSKSLEFE